jgi:NAD(P)-dependent dehydrogenase (short-subunit alcohol dehydrogenase family)
MPTILITGANRGIGLEFARQYAGAGFDVLATARESSDELDTLGVRVERLDLSDAEAVADFAGRIERRLDLFVANAGTNHPMDSESADDARAWQAMMMVNVIAPYMISRKLLPRMTRGGKMIAISSGMGSIAENSGGWIPYRTSKAALNMAWSSLSLEARPRGVVVAALSPGWVKTRMGGAGAEITAEQSVGEMRRLIDRLELDQSGGFFRRDGTPYPW